MKNSSNTEYSLGKNIKKALRKKGKRQQDLVDYFWDKHKRKIDKSHVSKWCNDVVNPNRENIKIISDFVDFSIEEIMSGQFKDEARIVAKKSGSSLILDDFVTTEIDSSMNMVKKLVSQAAGISEEDVENEYGSYLNVLKVKISSIAAVNQ